MTTHAKSIAAMTVGLFLLAAVPSASAQSQGQRPANPAQSNPAPVERGTPGQLGDTDRDYDPGEKGVGEQYGTSRPDDNLTSPADPTRRPTTSPPDAAGRSDGGMGTGATNAKPREQLQGSGQ